MLAGSEFTFQAEGGAGLEHIDATLYDERTYHGT